MRHHCQRDVMMPPLPAAPFVMIQPQLLLELLVILLDFPATLRQSDQAAQRIVRRQIAEEVLNWLFLRCRPFHQQPDLFMRWLAFMEAVGRLYPSGPEAGFQPSPSALPPANGLPSFRLLRHGLDRQRTLLTIMPGGGRPSHAPGLQQRARGRLELNTDLRPPFFDVAQKF